MSHRVPRVLTALGILLLVASVASADGGTRLLRFPDIHGDTVVFTYAGDLWLAPTDGGSARRLTSHPGLELFAQFSPDGRWIAFTGQYDGDEQVYVIPAEGGMPRQLTFYPARGPLPPRWGYDNQVYGWTPDGTGVLFRSMRDGWDLSDTRLYTVDLDGALPRALPMPVSGAGALSPDGKRVVYSPLVRDFRHWKRYEGGWAQDLWIFDIDARTARQVTDHPRSDRDPMWVGDKIYFASDRTGTLNLFELDPGSGALRQLTDSTVWDVRWPSTDGDGRIVYELDGELQVLEISRGTSRAIPIRVPDDGVARRPSRVSAAGQIEGFALSPSGERAVFSARGDIFSAPVEHGPTRNLTRCSGAHDREPAWSPDGRHIAFVSDASGEEEIWLVAQDGREPAERLTEGSTGRKYDPTWSPDGSRIAWRDQAGRLAVLEIESRETTQIADDRAPFGLTWSWSPRGGHLAYSLQEANGFRSLWIWSVADGESRRITGEMFNEFSPAFDPAGDYLYFLSDRQFQPQIGSYEFNYVLDRETWPYALALRDDVAHPFPPRSDEVAIGDDSDGDEEEGDPEDENPLRIDLEGLGERVARFPVEADNYLALSAVEGGVLLLRGGAAYYGRSSDRQPELILYTMEDRKEHSLMSGVEDGALSSDGSRVMVQTSGGYQVLAVEPGASGTEVSTGGLQVDRVPAEEWAQIFDEVWRRYRDFFYVDNLHGYDWEGLRERYRPLLEHVGHRSDLNYVLSEMIAELNTSHTYIAGGDYLVPERPSAALLGATFALDDETGSYRISDIFRGQNEEPTYRSPLTEVGVGVTVGDHVLAINGRPLTADENPYRLLRHAGGAPVELTVNDRPGLEGARTAVVEAISSEASLRYLRWVEDNRRNVAEATDGRVGYLHIPDMGGSGIREFIKGYYGQIRRQGLIIDVRSNGGGNVSPMILERLQRKLLMVDFERNQDGAETYPGVVFHGHLVCLLDEDTASDGDQFAYVFREAGLGPLIGKRSWGGVVGIYGRGPLIDGGTVFVPEAGSANAQGAWVIEGHGVDPDIEVENDPGEVLKGRDQQLERAIDEVMRRIQEEPRVLPERPAGPVKTG